MNRLLNLIGALLFLCWHAYGQSDYRPGVIMPKPGDSISGLIDYRNDIKNVVRCNFKQNNDLHTYNPFDIYGYRFTEGKFYISKYLKQNDKTIPLFVEYLVKGKKNLYYMRDEAGSHFLIDYRNDTVIEVVYKVDILYRDGFDIVGDSKIHQAYLKSYFSDCLPLSRDIENIQVPEISNMVNLTKKYHHLTCGDTGCIVFYKKPNRFRVDVEFRFGMIRYSEYSTVFEPQYSGLAHFWLPRSNERMYLVTGFSYGPLTNYDIVYSMHKVPLKFEYQMPFKVIRPRLEGGVNFMVIGEDGKQSGIGIDFPVSAGILVFPFEFLAIDLSVEGEFWPFFMMQEFKLNHFLLAYTFNAGLRIRF